jgi:hypothetical protein
VARPFRKTHPSSRSMLAVAGFAMLADGLADTETRSVSQFFIHNVQQRLSLAESLELRDEKTHGVV